MLIDCIVPPTIHQSTPITFITEAGIVFKGSELVQGAGEAIKGSPYRCTREARAMWDARGCGRPITVVILQVAGFVSIDFFRGILPSFCPWEIRLPSRQGVLPPPKLQ